MRNAGKRDRRCQRAVASLGKHYPFPYSESFAVTERNAASFVSSPGNTVSVTVADVRISRFQPHSNGVASFDACANEFTHDGSKPSQQTKAVRATYCSGAL